MKKYLALFFASTVSVSAFAELKMDLKGNFDFQSGTRFQQDLEGADAYVSPNQKGFAFYTEAHILGLISNKTDNDLEYGANIFLRATTNQSSSSSKNGSSIFVSHDNFGKVEAGSPFGVSKTMALTYDEIEIGSGNWTNYAVRSMGKVVDYRSYSFYVSGFRSNVGGAEAEPPRCISYYSPEFSGLQLGVTFTPDTANGGAGSNVDGSAAGKREITLPDKTTYTAQIAAKNVVSIGATYENKASEDLNFKISVTGDAGRASQKGTVSKTVAGVTTTEPIDLTGDKKVEDLLGYNVGAVVTYKDISLSASYADLGKSFSSPIVDAGRDKTVYFGVGAAYNNGPVGFSLTYGNTDHRKNVVQSYTVGTQYKLAPGLVSYADVTYFNAKGTDITNKTNQSTKGTILVFGLKLGI